jgi:hypothetical protein
MTVATGSADAGMAVGGAPGFTSDARVTGVRAMVQWIEARALYIAAVAAVAVVSLADVYLHIAQDTWLALVAGRIIASHGIPHHDYLTVMAHGVPWVDQQWLAQLAMYGLYRLGGLALLSVVYSALITFALTLGIVAARRLGATERAVLTILPFGAFFFIVTAVSVRTQGFGYPLFAVILWLLAADVRGHRGRRVYLVFPLLVLWGNLHGAVTMGVGVAVIYGATTIFDGYRARGLRGLLSGRGLAFIVGSPLTLLATPYGTAVIHYYRVTLANPEFSKLVTEWRPVTSVMVLAIPFLILVGAIVWLLGRSGRRTPLFDQLVLAMLALGGVDAVRNITWFGLAAVILAPAALTQVLGDRPAPERKPRLNLTIAGLAIAVALISAGSTLAKPARWFEQTYSQKAIPVIARVMAAHPGTKIFADVRFADWLVWHDPKLAGHIAYDTSFELLTAKQLESLSNLGETPLPGQFNPVKGYGLLVLDPKNRTTDHLLLRHPGVRVLLRNKRVIVATQPTA